MTPLNFVPIGKTQVIKRIVGNREIKKHLADLGLNIGSEISVLSILGSNLIVKVKESRIAVSSELAMRIMI